jgi:hypothetical protein
MRRIVTSLAVIGLLALDACTGGGSVLSFDNNSSPQATIVTVQGPTNIARVLPGASIALSATAVRGSQNGYVQVNRFKWSAAVTSGGTYIATADGSTKPCATLFYTPAGGTAQVFTPDMNFPPYVTITIDPVNEANIIFTPPTTLLLPLGAPVGSTVTPNFPYCVVVTATPLSGSGSSVTPIPSAAGSITVAVVNPAAPTQ